LRSHLETVKGITGQTPKELIPVEVSDIILYLWDWFLQLNSARQNNGFGVSPLSYLEIKAWSDLTQTIISPYEVRVIKQLDTIFINHYSKDK